MTEIELALSRSIGHLRDAIEDLVRGNWVSCSKHLTDVGAEGDLVSYYAGEAPHPDDRTLC